MTVYADVLFVVNFLVDFFLLLTASHILSDNVKTIRLITASVIGGIFSFYIFLPDVNLFFDFLFKLISMLIISLVAFKFCSFKRFIKSLLIFALVNCGYTGIMMSVWYLFKPRGMIINNSVVYFDISPVILVLCTVIAYILFTILSYVFTKLNKSAEYCRVKITAGDKSIDVKAVIDTGNSIKDVFGMGEIIIVDKKNANFLFGDNVSGTYNNRYRAIPCTTVSGGGLLDGYRCDCGIIESGERKIVLNKPVIAISKTKLPEDCSAIVNPDILY